MISEIEIGRRRLGEELVRKRREVPGTEVKDHRS
jgi:hypothetical protein